jgi:hypothetical protein
MERGEFFCFKGVFKKVTVEGSSDWQERERRPFLGVGLAPLLSAFPSLHGGI